MRLLPGAELRIVPVLPLESSCPGVPAAMCSCFPAAMCAGRHVCTRGCVCSGLPTGRALCAVGSMCECGGAPHQRDAGRTGVRSSTGDRLAMLTMFTMLALCADGRSDDDATDVLRR